MKLYHHFFILIFILVLAPSCKNKNHKSEIRIDSPKHLIEVSDEQFIGAGMKMGTPEQHLFSEVVSTKGYLKASAEGKANVSVFVPGKVKNIRYVMGDYVKKGAVLFQLEGNEIIDLQQNFAQNNAELKLAEYEYERVDKLVRQNIAAKKELQIAQRNLQSLKALNQGLKARLKLLNINPEKVEGGEISPTISLMAPISGYITQLNIVQGEYLEPQTMAIEVIDTRNLQLYLSVFETDILTLAKGQKVLFYDSDRKYRKFEGTLSKVGKAIDPESKTIQCIADINNKDDHNYVNGMYVECAVVTSERQSRAVPTEAVINDGFSHYVLVLAQEKDGIRSFSKVPVELGTVELEYSEIFTKGLENVLLSGVYTLIQEE